VDVRAATEEDLPGVLPLVRAYCEFYETTPEQAPDAGLEEMCRALIEAPDDQGMLLVATDDSGEVVGFAAVGWKWSSLRASRVAILEDLFVAPEARGGGHGRELILAVADRARELGAPKLEWVTARDNARAQAVYDSIGGTYGEWRNYELELGG
jgi:GNAT superfamily N-acetyltransferase